MMSPSPLLAAARTAVFSAAIAATVAGCGTPNPANIELRKKNQALEAQVQTLTAQHDRDTQTIAALRDSRPTIPTLPPGRLAALFTTHGLEFTNATSGDNPDATATFDTQLKLGINAVDQEGTSIKAAGSFKIEAFDLDDPAHPLIGTWTFDETQSKAMFFSRFALYGYVLTCPWQTKPVHENLTVKASFTDSLTGLTFTAQRQVKVRPAK
jgi:hypothetical protein